MQQVYFITDSWDNIPTTGIANYDNKPFYFDREFSDELDDWTDIYKLTELPEEIFELFLLRKKYWNIWKNQSKVPHPVHYEKMRNQVEIQNLVNTDKDWRNAEDNYLNNQIIGEFINKSNSFIRKRGIFKNQLDSEFIVEWLNNS